MAQRETLAQQRATAIGATRAQLRRMGIDPNTVDADGAWAALTDMQYINPDLIAVIWMREAYRRYEAGSDNQMRLFNREWRAAQRLTTITRLTH